MRERFKVSTLSLAILSSISTQALAFEEESKQQEDKKEQIEVIEVEGFRGSLLKSMNNKRNSTNVSDSIFAEDIGKSTDQNIADALSRVTGVSVQSVDGEGATITVRGANPNQNMISLNGVQLTSSDFNQAVDLSAFSSDILSSINVVKTPSADHDEGSLGASISLQTTKPLEVKEQIRSLTVQGRYNDFSENTDYKLSGSFSETFFDDTFGIIVTAFDETNSVRRDQYVVGDFEAEDVHIARDLKGNIVRNTRAIVQKSINYELYENERNRHGATLSLQYLPFDETSITLDLTHSKQELTDTNHKINLRPRADKSNFFEGIFNETSPQPGNNEFYPTYSDPQEDWWTIDNNSKTLVKSLNRFADGGFGRRNGGETTTNSVVNLNIEQSITADLSMELGVNFSETHKEPREGGTVDMNLSNGGMQAQVKARADAFGTPHTGIEPAGYDCTSGVCNLVYGEGLITLNDPDTTADNIGTAAFNPSDIRAQGVQWMALYEREVKDTQKTGFVDFDWDVDIAGITKVEFGAKYSEREKYVDDQAFTFRNTKQPIAITRYNSEGEPVGLKAIVTGATIGSIPADNYVSDEPFPYDNFMADLGFARNNITNGWQLVSEAKLLDLAYGNEDTDLTVDDSATRSAELESSAAYLKLNFEYLGGKLTGDVGVRYVKTDLITRGSSGANFATDGRGIIFDPFVWRQLRNRNNPACAITDTFGPNEGLRIENRNDGNGWDRNGTPDDYSDDVRIPIDPAGYPCFDPRTVEGADQSGWWWNWRHSDITTLAVNRFTDDPAAQPDNSKRSFKTVGSNTYDMYLPSLNLNYQVTDDIITRFAISKTMSRPNIDSLKPGFKMTEGFWGSTETRGGRLNLNNPELLPQESVNLDLSFEWYFNESSLFSTALFYKDMSNFEEREEQTVYADDLRTKDLSNYDLNSLVKFEEDLIAAFAADTTDTGYGICQPKRLNAGDVKKEWPYTDNLIDLCSQFTASKVRNGEDAEIKGIELSYQQNYDFLPGFLSGLGTTINYTFQESEIEQQESDIIPGKLLPSFPRAWTPKHSYNATVFWEKNGHLVRLAYRGNSDQLANRDWNDGALWQEGNGNFDLSANYKINDDMLLSFQVINLTDESTRIFYTSRNQDLGDTQLDNEGNVVSLRYDEGNVLDNNNITKSRTQREYKNGRTFRLGLRVNF